MNSYKRIKLENAQYTMLSGGTKHEIELPHGDLDVWTEWYSDDDCVVWLYWDNGLQLPYGHGKRGHFNVKAAGLISLVLTTKKSATVVVAVKYKNLAVVEQADWTPVEITPPKPAELQLSALINERVRFELERMGVLGRDDKTLEVSEEDELGDDESDEGFGPGYMEEEEPIDADAPEKPRPGDAVSAGNVVAKPSAESSSDEAKA